ncbi:MAG: hypothetical protein KKG84_03385, partial [Candidatus Omnitrophica bacterium]|nr:hypothetical protein [Candidatus Omnitrophota bacterium]
MSIANYILRQNGTIEDLPKWIRHHLTEEYSDWINLIDLEKSEKSHSELKLYLNYGQRSVRAEISLQENRPEKEEIFRIKIKETGFGQNSKDSPREDVILKDRGNIVEIGFSVLSSDPDKIIEEVQEVVDAGIDSIHVDHLDGVFTPGLPAFDCTDQIKKINGISVPLNVHLMAMSPSKELINKIIDSGLKSGRDSILVHYEAFNEAGDMDVIVKHIKEKGFKAGISINPETSIADLRNTLNRLNGYVSSVMVMSIIPGAGSRPFIKGTEEKVKDLDSLLVSMGIRSGIQIILDGGLNERSLGAIVETGADEIITRTWLLTNGPNYRKSLESIKNLSCHRIESIALNDLIEEWGLLNYNFIIDAIVRFCSGDKIFTKEEIISTVKRYYGVNKVLINEDKVVDIFYDDKLVRFHKDGILPIEHLGLRDRTYYDGIVVKIYTGNVVAEQKGEYILGISGSWHDSTAALIKDGKIVCALEEERMTRVKHDTSMFPVNAILRMMEDIGITWEDIKHISLGWNFNLYVDTPHSINPNSVLFREIDEKYARGKDIKIEDIVKRQNEEKNKERFNVKKIYGFLKEMSEYFGTKYEPRVSFVEHSRSHASSAYYLCGFEGKVLTLSLDGYGGFESGSVWLCENGTMKELTRFSLPHSIGWMWCAITEYMGFMPSADEGQIMGFAPYGEPWDSAEMERVNKLREIFKDYMRFDTKQEKLISNPENYYYGEMVEGKTRITKSFRKKMEELGICPYGRATHQIDPKNPEDRAYANLAFVLQERTSQVICDIVRYYFREKVSTKGIEKLALAGGVALNILSNGKLITEGLVYGENIFVQPAAGDSGVSLGSSLTVAREIYGDDVNVEMKHALYGPEYSNEEIRGTLEEFGLTEGIDYVTATDEKLVKYAADFINKEKAIAWFQGKSEIGPRALGARSILLNLNDVQANNTANIIKGRQPWRPSASSIAEEYAKDYFMGIGKSPFMIVAFPILFSKKNIVLSGMHEFGDKLARPQTVSKETNPLYWELLTRLGEISNIPAVVNTSFNKQE